MFFRIAHTWFMRRKYAVVRNYYIKATSVWENLEEIPSSHIKLLRNNYIQIGTAFRNAIATYGKHHGICARFCAAFRLRNMIQKKMKFIKTVGAFDEDTAHQ